MGESKIVAAEVREQFTGLKALVDLLTATNGLTSHSYTDTTLGTATNRFYRVKLVLP